MFKLVFIFTPKPSSTELDISMLTLAFAGAI